MSVAKSRTDKGFCDFGGRLFVVMAMVGVQVIGDTKHQSKKT